jgi:DNA-binding transcriptional LysR family regulator
VAAAVRFGRLRLLALIGSLRQNHPRVRIDLAARVRQLPDSSHVARRIGVTRRRPVVHRMILRPLQREGPGPPRHPSELAQHNCLVCTELATRNPWTFVAGPGGAEPPGTEHAIRAQASLQTNRNEVIRVGVLSGMGVGYSPDWHFEKEARSGEVLTLDHLVAFLAPP